MTIQVRDKAIRPFCLDLTFPVDRPLQIHSWHHELVIPLISGHRFQQNLHPSDNATVCHLVWNHLQLDFSFPVSLSYIYLSSNTRDYLAPKSSSPQHSG